ncbi:nuclear transport factor 2 family protein [Chryseolinea sp. T2]|uniref:nuclear transport factor 2 family protein n=1 Tax=Chryseolinea sp. T2 TaxID=3129255 RepID=UPI0030783367
MNQCSLLCICVCLVSLLSRCSNDKTTSRAEIKSEIERILKIQEDAYGNHSEHVLEQVKATCMDSLVFVGGDTGGMVASADFYVHDLADGYMIKPHDYHFQIYDDMVIVSSVHQGYKLLSNDTLLLNSRSTKIFTRDGDTWKMAYVTYAPLPVMYNKIPTVAESVLKRYEGKYRLDSSTVETVSVRDGKLISTIGASDVTELIPYNDSTFLIDGVFGKSVFVKGKDGRATGYYYEWTDGQRISFPAVK